MTARASSRQIKLAKETELRVEVAAGSPFRLRVTSGKAEIFGSELPPECWQSIQPSEKFAVFSWHGATLEVEGRGKLEYVSDQTPMVSYFNVHKKIERRRARAKASSSGSAVASQGPRVLVVGPMDSGKSSLSKMLLNWSCKQGWKPTFVDLDIGQGSITAPGCIAFTTIETPVDVVKGIPIEMQVVFYYGHTTPTVNRNLYKVLVQGLAQTLESHFLADAESRESGMIVNTMGWIEGLGFELLLHAVDTFTIDIIIVLGHEGLYTSLKEETMRKENIKIVKLQKSEGVASRKRKFRQTSRNSKIMQYFYGPLNDLPPPSYRVNFSDVSVYRFEGSSRTLPTEPQIVSVDINEDLLHSVLAVSYAEEPSQILSNSAAALIYITKLNIQRKKITYLSPWPAKLSARLLVVGTLKWLNS